MSKLLYFFIHRLSRGWKIRIGGCESSKRYVNTLILVYNVVIMGFGDGEISRDPNFINVCNLGSNLGRSVCYDGGLGEFLK